MKHQLATAVTLLTVLSQPATADVYSQPPRPGDFGGILSSVVTDNALQSSYSMDDFTVTGQGWVISALTFIGETVPDQFGNNALISPFDVRLCTNNSWTSPGTVLFAMTQPSMLLSPSGFTISGLNVALNPGHYWLSGWGRGPLMRPWYWRAGTGGPYGDPAYVQNPGGAFGLGTDPVQVQSVDGVDWRDQAFSITYTPVPEPSTLVILGCGYLALIERRRVGRGKRTSSY